MDECVARILHFNYVDLIHSCTALGLLLSGAFNDFVELMTAEHCKEGWGHDFEFPVKGSTKNLTSPMTEWELVMKIRTCPDKGGRRIREMDALLSKKKYANLGLSLEKVIAVVLYTGPMVSN